VFLIAQLNLDFRPFGIVVVVVAKNHFSNFSKSLLLMFPIERQKLLQYKKRSQLILSLPLLSHKKW